MVQLRRSRTWTIALCLGSAAALTVPALAAAAASTSLPLSGLPSGPTEVSGYELGASSLGATFAGTATGALHGAWTATLALPLVSPLATPPSSLAIDGGKLTLSALGQTFTVAVAPATLALSDATVAEGDSTTTTATTAASAVGAAAALGGGTSTTTGSSATESSASTAPATAAVTCAAAAALPATVTGAATSTGSATTSAASPSSTTAGNTAATTTTSTSGTSAAATSTSGTSTTTTGSTSNATTTPASACSSATTTAPAIIPATLGGAEEMLQVYSGAYYAAKGDTQAQQGLMALGQQIETALPALSVLGQFPLAASAIVSPPNVLIPASATTCGDLAYNGSLDLSLEGIAGGTFTGQLILYRTETASGCATFASAVSGTLVISSSLVPAASSSVPSTSAAAS